MSRRGAYIGGHTVLTQRPGDFERELARDALEFQKQKADAQRQFDELRERQLSRQEKAIRRIQYEAALHELKRRRETMKKLIKQNPGLLTWEIADCFAGPTRRRYMRAMGRRLHNQKKKVEGPGAAD